MDNPLVMKMLGGVLAVVLGSIANRKYTTFRVKKLGK